MLLRGYGEVVHAEVLQKFSLSRVRVRHAPTGIGIRLKKSHNARFENVEVLACEPDQGYGLPACSPRTLRKQPVGPNPTKDGYNIRCEESQWSHFTNIRLSGTRRM